MSKRCVCNFYWREKLISTEKNISLGGPPVNRTKEKPLEGFFDKKFEILQKVETQPTVVLGDLGGLIFQRFAQICFCGSKINFRIFDKKVQKWPKSAFFAFFGGSNF